MLKSSGIIFLCLFAHLNILQASIDEYFPFSVGPSASIYGETGIIVIPNARMMTEASLRFNFSSSFPNEYTSLTASPFNWFEATYRYTEIKNKNYGPASYSGNQSLKDKGFDLKVLLKEEGYNSPAIAFGIRDLAGTGIFSSEYLVGTKGIGNFDLSIGLGWGLLGTESSFSNPFGNLGQNFKERGSSIGQGGSFSYQNWFSGRTAIFGGMEYKLQKKGLRLKLEYDTSNPDEYETVEEVKSRLNIGASFAYSDNLIFSASFDRGTNFRLSFQFLGNFLQDSLPKPKPKTVQKLNISQIERLKEDNSIFYRSLNKSLQDESIYIQAANYQEKKVDVAVASPRFYSLTRSAGRTARIVSALSQPEVEEINIYSMNGDFEVAKFSFNRKELDEAYLARSSANEIKNKSKIVSSDENPLYQNAYFIPKITFPEFEWNMSPAIKHQIGGPEGFYLGQLYWRTDTSIKFRRNLSLYTSFGINIFDTFDGLNNPSQSTIPRVRSDIQEYLTQGKNNIQRMQLEYFGNPRKDLFYRIDFGLMEEMFGGYGGEILYRPFTQKYSFGLALHKVRQRGYKQRFSFRDYSTLTGHLGFYYDLPQGINAQVQLGKYLAGDKGITLDLSRRFNSGFTLGIFATKTNLSAEEFGEGSFDKGFYISIPTQLFYSDFRTGNISFGLHPLTKDGGAILNKHNSLFSILGDSNLNSIERDWKYILQ